MRLLMYKIDGDLNFEGWLPTNALDESDDNLNSLNQQVRLTQEGASLLGAKFVSKEGFFTRLPDVNSDSFLLAIEDTANDLIYLSSPQPLFHLDDAGHRHLLHTSEFRWLKS